MSNACILHICNQLIRQTADSIEELFNARLPPSRRLDKYKPVKSDQGDLHRDEKGGVDTIPTAPLEWDTQQETLRDEEEAIQARIRAEVSNDLSLGPVVTRASRRGSEITVTAETLTARRPSQVPRDPDHKAKQESLNKRLGKSKAKKVIAGLSAEEGGVYYDMSAWRAIFLSIRIEWFKCVAIMGSACKLHSSQFV